MKPRMELCEVCREPLPQSGRGRPRETCGDRCRKRKQRLYPSRSGERRQKEVEAWKTIQRWERRFGALTQTSPEWEPLTLRDRLMIRLRRGWPIPFCITCQRPYLVDMSGRIHFCSDDCLKAARPLRELAKRRGKPDPLSTLHEPSTQPLRLCAECGKVFVPTDARHKYHNAGCRLRAYRYHWRKCVECGTKFKRKSSHPKERRCSEACRIKAENRRVKIKSQAVKIAREAARDPNCKHCHQPIPPERTKSMYCSKKCERAALRLRKGMRPKRLGKAPKPITYLPGRASST